MADWFTDADVEAVGTKVLVTILDWRGQPNSGELAMAVARAVLTSLAPRIAHERADALREAADFLESLKAESISPPWLRARADRIVWQAQP